MSCHFVIAVFSHALKPGDRSSSDSLSVCAFPFPSICGILAPILM